jgi:hypothetical protein
MAIGHKTGGRQKGSKSEKTILWQEMGEWIVNHGTDRYLTFLKELDGENYMKRFEAMLEYFKPKLARSVDKDGNDAPPLSITVTFKNERDNNPNSIQGTVPEIEV